MKIFPSPLPATLVIASCLGGCVVGPAPRNLPDSAWAPQQRPVAATARSCTAVAPTDLMPAGFVPATALVGGPAPLAPGDRLRLRIAGDNDQLSGVHVIAEDGSLAVAGLERLTAAGLTEARLQRTLGAALVAARLIRPLGPAIDLRLIESAGVDVAVTGAVFAPGVVRTGERNNDNRIGQKEGAASGDANAGANLAAALRAAGGVRPDADVGRIYLLRGARWTVVDLEAAVAGAAIDSIAVTAGDKVIVQSSGCFRADLVRPTAITQPGIRVHMSNLSRPGNNNAGSAIGKDSESLPYGTRLLQGLVEMNCVGGSAMNASRRAVLISRNPMNGQSIVIERAVEKLVRSADRDAEDPYLMPGDALACYDSRAMNVADAINLVSGAFNAVTPAVLLRNAARN
ncbi:MAG: polysaccharide biosynthesis protein [Alphaproteobacteria bacterium]|nr:MAG: polysaccharide biosynthesis protein [Alphaproteobacteria bacterium]